MSLSTLRGASETKAHASKNHRMNIPIPLERPKERKYQKHEYLSFKLKNQPTLATSSEYEFTMPFFSTGTPEETILMVSNIKKVFKGLNLTTGQAQFAIVDRVLKGDAHAAFSRFAGTHGAQTPGNMSQCLDDLIEHFLPKRALTYQKRAMRRFMRKPVDMTMRDFMSRLTEINAYLEFFPPFEPDQVLPSDEIVDIGEFAIPMSWQREMVLQGFEPADHDASDLVDFCDRFEQAELNKPMKSRSDKIPRKRKQADAKWCEICHMNNHNTEECSWLAKSRKLKSDKPVDKTKYRSEARKYDKGKHHSQKSNAKKEQTFSVNEVKQMMGTFANQWRKKEREENHNVHNDTEEFFSDNDSSDQSVQSDSTHASAHGLTNLTDADKALMDDVIGDE